MRKRNVLFKSWALSLFLGLLLVAAALPGVGRAAQLPPRPTLTPTPPPTATAEPTLPPQPTLTPTPPLTPTAVPTPRQTAQPEPPDTPTPTTLPTMMPTMPPAVLPETGVAPARPGLLLALGLLLVIVGGISWAMSRRGETS